MTTERELLYRQLELTWLFYAVGDEVEVCKDIYEGADDCHPGGYVARKGDKVIIREIASTEKQYNYPFCRVHPFSVAHEWVTGKERFVIGPHEIAPWRDK